MALACGCRGSSGAETTATAANSDPRADDARNVRLVGYHDLQGRESLVVTTLSDAANGSWVYVGHHEHYWDRKPKLNPITGKEEWNGTSILNVADPANPKLVWHIPNDTNRNSRGVSVVYDYKFDGSGRDYLIRNSEALTQGETGTDLKYQIFDLKDPKAPKFIGRAWLPSQKDGEPGYEGQYAHHPVVDEQRKRLYVGYRNSGWTAEFDIADPAHPKLVWSLDMNPPHRGPHTVSPIVYDTVPNFGKEALPRRYAFVVDEAGGTADMAPCPGGVRPGSYMLDITNESKPFPVSVWQVPVGNFCNKGGRFGPHQSAETVNGRINRFENKIAWLAYFNAGIRVLDLSDPYNLKELGYYLPKTNDRSHPIAMGQPTVIQINDVDIDARGLAYASDRVGTGLFILEYRRSDE